MFYGTYMREDPSRPAADQLTVRAQKMFFDSAKNVAKVVFYEGHFSGGGKEKGVDVRLAVDMVFEATQGKYQEAAIMTGDADLTYAVEKVRGIGLPVHLTAFGPRFPYAISFKANRRLVYDLNNFFVDTVLPGYRNPPRYVQVRDLTRELPLLDVETQKRPGA